ncbi:3-isopropylmalate dehydrogenase [Mucisphaera calidilacus]|uniref:3-isopropylmalate dehydrogenase n=1 Tax=Mucisphaera calidilacus TaxID=2527982 RepID=A0A518BYF3_9BACT|nr:3-isopropylmalate dehydrogenase [Mucisphaera calidilacus]QDU71988.1 3-isopropylmalate dehydrogenase [Mucisphaera calidilacus]
MSLNLAVIGGDGTGPEVVAQALRVLDQVAKDGGFEVQTTPLPYGGERYLETGTVLTDDEVEGLKAYDAILLGAVGHADVPPGVLEKGILLKLRFELDQYINLRPVKLYPGIETPLAGKGPDEIDMVVVRENTEDLYCGNGGVARRGTAQEISTQEMIATRFGVERCLRYAFELARSRKAQGFPGRLTLVHKTNVLTFCGGTWFRAFEAIGEADYADIEREYHHVDACCMYLATKPEIYDTVVVPNMFGDIITDLGAAIAGGMGIAASGNLNPDPSNPNPSMFEPVHGSSPDIAGQNKANPLACIDSLAMLLRETGRTQGKPALEAAGERVGAAVLAVTPKFTGKKLDRSGYGTSEIGDMVLEALGAIPVGASV